MTKQGIILANTGSPAEPTPEAVRVYLRDFLTDPRIAPMNPLAWKTILHAFVLPRRSAASAEKYGRIWTPKGSPLLINMASLAARLESVLDDCVVRPAMSYGSPSMQDALRDVRAACCDSLVVIPLYPQSAHSTTRVVEDKLREGLDTLGWQPPVRFVESYGERDEYISAIAGTVRQAGYTQGDFLLFAFHSIPLRDVRTGDTYADQAHASARRIARLLAIDDAHWGVGFQCRFDKSRRWVGPSTFDAIEGLVKGGGRLFVVAPNFSIDCLETLYDIDIELRGKFEALAFATDADDLRYVPCLNDSAAHVGLLKSLISDNV